MIDSKRLISRFPLIVFGILAFATGFPATLALGDSDGFYKALKREDVVSMSQYVDQIDDANMRLEDGRTALMMAAKLGSSEIVRKLLNAGADINDRNFNGGTALMYSAIRGDQETLTLLLENGAEVNLDAKFGWTALMVAAAKGHTDQVSVLLEYGANANVRDIYEWTPLMRATFSGHGQTVAALLNHAQTDVDAQDENGATALHHAATNGFEPIVELLLERDASMAIRDRFGLNARDRAVANEHAAIAGLLSQQY